MRACGSYRGARRNLARARDGLRTWRDSGKYAAAANAIAKVDQRAEQCAEARRLAYLALARQHLATGKRRDAVVVDALREYWSKQRRTRVVSRILKGLGAAA